MKVLEGILRACRKQVEEGREREERGLAVKEVGKGNRESMAHTLEARCVYAICKHKILITLNNHGSLRLSASVRVCVDVWEYVYVCVKHINMKIM